MNDVFTTKMKALEKAFQQELEFDETHAAFMVDDVVFDFAFDESTGQVLVYAVLSAIELLSAAQRNAIYAQVLKAQYCFVECGGFTFGVDPDETMLNLQAQWKLDTMEDLDFVQKMEAFMNTAVAWTKTITQLSEASESEGDSAPIEGSPLDNNFGIMV